MRNNNQTEWSEAEYAAWLAEVGGVHGESGPSEEGIAATISEAIREQSPKLKAQLFIDAANMCMAMADKTLGFQGLVSTSLELKKH